MKKREEQDEFDKNIQSLRDCIWTALQKWTASVDITKREGQGYIMTVLIEGLGMMIADSSSTLKHGEQGANNTKDQIMDYVKEKFKEKK